MASTKLYAFGSYFGLVSLEHYIQIVYCKSIFSDDILNQSVTHKYNYLILVILKYIEIVVLFIQSSVKTNTLRTIYTNTLIFVFLITFS